VSGFRTGPAGPDIDGGGPPGAAEHPATLPPKATPVLRALEAQARASLTPAEVDTWLHGLEQERAAFTVAMVVVAPGARRAEVLHMLLAREFSRLPPLRPTCARGCCACCHYEVEITGDEADLLAERVEGGLTVDVVRLIRQAMRPRRDQAWERLGSPDNRCVFLGADGACGVYAYRPAACRKALVVSPPVECGRPGGVTRPITIPRAELAIAAALALPGATFGSLSSQLLAALARRAERARG